MQIDEMIKQLKKIQKKSPNAIVIVRHLGKWNQFDQVRQLTENKVWECTSPDKVLDYEDNLAFEDVNEDPEFEQAYSVESAIDVVIIQS